MSKKEICHVCKKEKKPYIVFMNMDIMNMISHDQAREDGPICERCDRYFAMTGKFKEPTKEEFELAREANIFAHTLKEWWEKDRPLAEDDDSREWGGTHGIARWYRKKYGSLNTGKVKA